MLLETAEDSTVRVESRVTALHCLRDISDSKHSVAADNAEAALSKVRPKRDQKFRLRKSVEIIMV